MLLSQSTPTKQRDPQQQVEREELWILSARVLVLPRRHGEDPFVRCLAALEKGASGFE